MFTYFFIYKAIILRTLSTLKASIVTIILLISLVCEVVIRIPVSIPSFTAFCYLAINSMLYSYTVWNPQIVKNKNLSNTH